MRRLSTPLLNKTKEFVAGFIADNITEKICYHNIDHTLEAVEAAEVIGHKLNIPDQDLEIVLIAAWFHDTGYFLGCEDHEEASASIMARFLKEESVDEEMIAKVRNCILATKIPQSPQNILEKIVCDADLYHLGTDKFFDKSELLWHELALHDQEMSPESWLEKSKSFVEDHRYHTSFGKTVLLPKLKKNLELLKLKIREFHH